VVGFPQLIKNDLKWFLVGAAARLAHANNNAAPSRAEPATTFVTTRRLYSAPRMLYKSPNASNGGRLPPPVCETLPKAHRRAVPSGVGREHWTMQVCVCVAHEPVQPLKPPPASGVAVKVTLPV
jgi:hypothetical protein